MDEDEIDLLFAEIADILDALEEWTEELPDVTRLTALMEYFFPTQTLEEPTLQQRIDALPDASDPNITSYYDEIVAIWKLLYALPSTGETPPDITNLTAATRAALPVAEQCWVVTPTALDNWGSQSSTTLRDYLRDHAADNGAAFKQYVKDVLRDVTFAPANEKPSSVQWARIHNQIGDPNRPFFTVHDRMYCFVPDTVADVNRLDDDQLAWMKDKHGGTYTDLEDVWRYMKQELGGAGPLDLTILNMDVSALVALSQKVFTLAQRAAALPGNNQWYYINRNGDRDKTALLREEVLFLYNKFYGWKELAAGETIPTFTTSESDMAMGLFYSAKNTLSIAERIDLLPTVEQFNAMSAASKSFVRFELRELYSLINALSVSASPAMDKLIALTPLALTLQDRINCLPPTDKIRNMGDADQQAVADEVSAIYAAIAELTETDTYPDAKKLRTTAAAVMSLQDRIDALPDKDTVKNGGSKYYTFIYEEVQSLRTAVDALPAGSDQPDTTRLKALEKYFNESGEVIHISTKEGLLEIILAMNASDKPCTKTAILDENIDLTSSEYAYKDKYLEKGTLNILGDGHTLSLYYPLGVAESAKMNLGAEDEGDSLTITSSYELEGMFTVKDSSVLNIYSGTVLGPSEARAFSAGISASGHAVVNLCGGTITECTSTQNVGAVNIGGYAVFNMYDGVIERCSGGTGGAVACTSANEIYFGEGNIRTACTFNMFGGEIRYCNASRYGGGAYYVLASNGADFNMSGGTIYQCTTTSAQGYGGAFFLYTGSAFTMTGGTIEKCSPTAEDGLGGAIFLYGSNPFTMTGGTIKDCSAAKGGAIYAQSSCSVNIGGTAKLIGNEASSSGGAIYAPKTTTISGSAKLTGNKATNYGGAVYMNTGTLNIKDDALIEGNTAAYGGGVYNVQSAFTVSDDAQIKGNTADYYGGGILLAASGTTKLTGGSVSENTAQYGGGIFINTHTQNGTNYSASLTLNGGSITDNTATYEGGGLYQSEGLGQTKLMRGAITGNKADVGGGMCLEGNVALVHGSAGLSVYDNHAASAGDDVVATASAGLTLGRVDTKATMDCGHKVTGWYWDAYMLDANTGEPASVRWSDDLDPEKYILVTDEVFDQDVFLKAAHDVISVSFDLNYTGAPEEEAPPIQRVTTKAEKPTDPKREGYRFLGWFENRATDPFDFDTVVPASMTLYAHWQQVLTVFFDHGDGTVTEQQVEQGETATSFIPTRTDYEFVGWYDKATDAEFDFTTPITEDVELIAKWNVTVTFTDRGTNTTEETIPEGGKVTQPEDPMREGYEFLGWYVGDEEFDFSTPVTEAVEITAKWGVTVSINDGTNTTEETIPEGGKITQPEDPTREGYEFLGWYVGDEEFDFGTPVTEKVTITAKWGVTVSINDGTNTTEETIPEGGKITQPEDPTREGYEFLGWYVGDEEFDFSTPVTEKVTITAKWGVTVTISDGTNTTEETIPEGGKITQPEDPTREGYEFLGWYVGDEEFDFSTPVTEKVTITAKWGVTVSINDGTNTTEETIPEGGKVTQPEDPTREGYEFLGWYIGDEEFDFSTPITEAVEITAKWGVVITMFDGTDAIEEIVPEGTKITQPEDPKKDGFEFLYWHEEEEEEPFDFDVTVTEEITLVAEWRELPVLTIVPQDISSYMGGSSASGGRTSTLRFAIGLPDGMKLEDFTFTMHLDNGKTVEARDEDSWIIVPYIVQDSDYFLFPTLELGMDLQSGDDLTGEFLRLERVNTVEGTTWFAVELNDADNWHLTACADDELVYLVKVDPNGATVTSRYLSGNVKITPVVSGIGSSGAVTSTVAVIPNSAEFYTNGISSGLGMVGSGYEDSPLFIGLLSDEILSGSLTEQAMIHHAEECTEVQDFTGWTYAFRYLDLINCYDGNAWVACNSDVILYLPYPADVLSNTSSLEEIAAKYEFVVLHYKGAEREYLDAEGDWEGSVLHPDGQPLEVTKFVGIPTEYGIKFVLPADPNGNMSPFALLWRTKAYTVTYTDGVDGEEIFPDQVTDAEYGDETPAFDGTPTRDGYRFLGWEPELAQTVTENAVYTARWELAVHVHSWDDGVVTTPPSCTRIGVKTYTCAGCGETKLESIPATGHHWNNGVVTVQPTKNSPGLRLYTCLACGATRTEVVPYSQKTGDTTNITLWAGMLSVSTAGFLAALLMGRRKKGKYQEN